MSKEALTGVPLSKSARRPDKKKSHGVHVEPCICSVCGQRANAAPGSSHIYCDGMPPHFFERAPALRGHVHGSKGEWVTMSDYKEAEKVWVDLRKVIALFTLLAPPQPEMVEPIKVGVVVETGKLGDRMREHPPRKGLQKAA